MEKQAFPSPFDLHVLGAPPAFVLSQDQTLCLFYIYPDLLGPDKYLKFSPLVFQITCVRTSRTQILLSGFPLLFIFQGPFSRCQVSVSLPVIFNSSVPPLTLPLSAFLQPRESAYL